VYSVTNEAAPKPKLGIVTYHLATNEGAMLQAYSLSGALARRFPGFRVEIVNESSRRSERQRLRNCLRVWPTRPLAGWRRMRRMKEFWCEKLPLSPERLVTDDYERQVEFVKDRYDVLVTGSDMVWSIDVLVRPFPSIFWLHPDLPCKKIAYAASADRCDFDSLEPWKRSFAAKAIDAFDLVGVRDHHTYDSVRSLCPNVGDRLQLVPDPTFLLDTPSTGVAAKLRRLGVDLDRPVAAIGLFSFRRRRELTLRLCEHFHAKGFQCVGVSLPNRFVDVDITDRLRPDEWAEAFRHFSFYVGAPFHGLVFALKNRVPCVSLEMSRAYKGTLSKMRSVLRLFDLEDNIVGAYGPDDYANVIKTCEQVESNWDADAVQGKLGEMRGLHESFLARMKQTLN
jgi:hypothetical protein